MDRWSYQNAKCSKLDKNERRSQRMCIAVCSDESENIKTEYVAETEAEAKPVHDMPQEAVTEDRAEDFVKKLQTPPSDANLWGKFCKYIREYLVFDTVVGREKKKGSFGHKCVTKAEFIKNYMSVEKNRPAVALGGSVALAAIALLVVILNFTVGFEAIVNGQSVGVVSSKQRCEEIINEVNETLVSNFGQSSKIDADIVAIPRLVARDAYTPENEVKNAVCMLSDKMHEMYVIHLGDTQLCALASEEEAAQVLQKFRDYYTGGREDVSFETDQQLFVVAEQAPVTLLRSVDEAVRVLNGSEKQENEYTIKPGDTLWSISRRFDTSVDELISINEGLDENIVDGDVITVKSYVPVVTVTTTQIQEYTQKIAYETEVVETDGMYRGRSEIAQRGENGEEAVVANVVKQNGQEVARDIISQTTVKEPVTQIKKVGTKEPPSGYGTGTFIAPVYGTITSRYGYRGSGFHKGVDIANSTGTPIRAADNGVVITAGWDGLFGKLVKLDHQNGYVTYYAHNSSIAVSVGDTVQKGEVIAYMGSTGNSTGPHCHFEIHKNGVIQNPSNYI